MSQGELGPRRVTRPYHRPPTAPRTVLAAPLSSPGSTDGTRGRPWASHSLFPWRGVASPLSTDQIVLIFQMPASSRKTSLTPGWLGDPQPPLGVPLLGLNPSPTGLSPGRTPSKCSPTPRGVALHGTQRLRPVRWEEIPKGRLGWLPPAPLCGKVDPGGERWPQRPGPSPFTPPAERPDLQVPCPPAPAGAVVGTGVPAAPVGHIQR